MFWLRLRGIWIRGIPDVLVRAQVNNNICICCNSGFCTTYSVRKWDIMVFPILWKVIPLVSTELVRFWWTSDQGLTYFRFGLPGVQVTGARDGQRLYLRKLLGFHCLAPLFADHFRILDLVL